MHKEKQLPEVDEKKYMDFVDKYGKLIAQHHKELIAGLKITKLNSNQKNKMVERLRKVDTPFVHDYADIVEKTGLALTAEMAWEDLDPETVKIFKQMHEQVPEFRKPSDSK